MLSYLRISANIVAQTFRICFPTTIEALGNRVSMDECSDRLNWWAHNLTDDVNMTVNVRGTENIDPNEVYVVMSNHASHYDVPVLFRALPIKFRMVAKTELFRIPIFGAAMTASGFIELDRKNRERAMESLAKAKAIMEREKLSIWIAPEGTSSTDGVLGAFKQGGFHTAIDAGLRILPVTLIGTNDVFQKGTNVIHRDKSVDVIVHAPISATAFGHERRSELVTEVRNAIASALPESKRGSANT